MTSLEFHNLSSYAIDRRRDFHKYPEKGWHEFRTTAIIFWELSHLGYSIKWLDDFIPRDSVLGRDLSDSDEFAEKERALREGADREVLRSFHLTGLIAEITAPRQGSTRGFRFDIDCVEVDESEDPERLPARAGFRSVHRGLMHACGHDGHAALGLAMAKYVSEHLSELSGKYVFIFQPAEEGCRGGEAVSRIPLIGKINDFVSFHLGMNVPSGLTALNPTNFLASTKFNVAVHGKAAHAGIEPWKGINALDCAAKIAVKLFQIPKAISRTARLNIGKFRSDNGRNVVADLVTMQCETRGIDSAENNAVFSEASDVIHDEAEGSGCRLELRIVGKSEEIVNSPELVDLLRNACIKTGHGFLETAPFNASEDSSLIEKVIRENGGRTLHFILGNNTCSGHHTPDFDLDEASLVRDIQLLAEVIRSI